jgi:glycosyltransferase involved in cell wall biosynthesis
MKVVPNGFDVERFRPDAEARAAVRAELRLSAGDVAFTLAARFHPVKDHRTLLAAAAAVVRACPNARFILCGEGVAWSNGELDAAIGAAGARAAFRLLGKRNDVARIFAASDVAVSSSLSEGFPNTIGEAMACGLPCVVTDVGESAAIVGPAGRVVPPCNPRAMADALVELAQCDGAARKRLGWAARARVEKNFAIGAVVRRYEELYRQAAGMRPAGQSDRAVFAET